MQDLMQDIITTPISQIAQQSDLVFPPGLAELFDSAMWAGERAFLLEGEPGTGKTALGRAIGGHIQREGGTFIFAQANAWTSDEFIIRGVDLAGFVERDPERVYAPGLLMKVADASADGRPIFVLLDEWDKTRPVADGLLLAALEERIVVDSAGNFHGKIGENVIFWITSNATRELHDALLRRLFRVRLPRMRADDLRKLLMERAGAGPHLASTLVKLRNVAARSQIVLTLPDLIRAARVLQHVESVDEARFLADGLVRRDFRYIERKDIGADLWAAVVRDRKEGRG